MNCKVIINKTPHPITVITDSKKIEIPPEHPPIRLKEKVEKVGTLKINAAEVPVIKKELLPEAELPKQKEGVCYIVSLAVAQKFKDRKDLLVTGEAVRDKEGKIIGTKSFAVVE